MNAAVNNAVQKIKNNRNNNKKQRNKKYKPKSSITELSNLINQQQIRTKNPVGKLSRNPIHLRGKNREETLDLATKFRQFRLYEFLYGALHPAQAVKCGLDVKMPSDLPIPSACIRVTTTYTCTTGANGVICLNYCPGALIGSRPSNGEITTLSFNNTGDGNGIVGTNSYVQSSFMQVPEVYDRWRLTASEMNLSYLGEVLKQSGIMHSCVHYEPVGYAYKGSSGTGSVTTFSNPNIDRFSGNHAIVKMGLWNSQVNITNDGHGITHIHTPTSIDDYRFSGLVSTSSTQAIASIANNAVTLPNTSNAGSSTTTSDVARSYLFVARGLPINSPCLVFTVHEVYEFLPETSSVSILKLDSDNISHDDYSHISSITRQPNFSRKNTTWDKVKTAGLNLLDRAVTKMDLPKVLGAVAKMII